MKILVTGGVGYIGGHFVNKAYKDHEILVVDNFSEGRHNIIDDPAVTYCNRDIRDKKKLLTIFEQFKPDIVDHFAACSSISASKSNPAELYETNITGSLNVLECMRTVGCKKIIFMSSAAVYKGGLVTEESLVKPANPYGRSKLMFEQILQDYSIYGIESVIFRPFSVGGCDENLEVGCYHKQHWQFFPNLILSFTQDKIWDVHGDGSAVRDFIHVNDVVDAHMLMIKKFIPGTYNLAKGFGNSIMSVIEKATKIIGKKPNYHLSDIQAVPLNLVGDPTRMWQLGWKVKRSIEDMITSEYNFFKSL